MVPRAGGALSQLTCHTQEATYTSSPWWPPSADCCSDTTIAIINGALVFLKRQFGLTDFQTEVAASALLVGCVIGAAVAGTLSDRYGRRKILIASAAIFAISAVAAAIPRDLTEFTIARFIGGLAIGVASVLSPLYIAEMAPADIRGRLVALNQLAIVSGILLAYFASWVLSDFGDASWRWMFASAAVPSVLFLVALIPLPESPRWLIKENQPDAALEVLKRLNPPEIARGEAESISAAVAEEGGSIMELLKPALRRPLFIAVMLAILQQITGVNTILFYGSLIYTGTGRQPERFRRPAGQRDRRRGQLRLHRRFPNDHRQARPQGDPHDCRRRNGSIPLSSWGRSSKSAPRPSCQSWS